MLNESEIMDLEILVDTHGLAAVIAALVNVCHEKSAHVSSVWQDKPLARVWMQHANNLERVETRIIRVGDLP